MSEIPIDRLLTAQDDDALMRVVYAYGLDAVLNGLFDEGVRLQYTDPAATLESRVAALESRSTRLHEQLAKVEEKLKAKSDEIAQEATHRQNADKEILDRLKYDSEKVLKLGAAGALLLFFGVILTTFPVELANFILRLKAA